MKQKTLGLAMMASAFRLLPWRKREKMKLRLTASILIEGRHHAKGEVLELPAELAKDLVEWHGSAEYVETSAAGANAREHAEDIRSGRFRVVEFRADAEPAVAGARPSEKSGS